MSDWLETAWPIVASVAATALALLAAGHAVLTRRDSRAALLWVGLVWLSPIVGAILYFLFGINRVRRRARVLRSGVERVQVVPRASPVTPERLAGELAAEAEHLGSLQRLVEQVVERPLLPGNELTPLVDGDQTYPAMLEALDSAERSVTLASYIFNADATGRAFVDRLAAAARRGAEVRVLVDDAGAHYSFPQITRFLRRAGIPAARFHPRPWLLPTGTLNMRNHRKILVVDGRVGFTGSMNIKRGHVLAGGPRGAVRDVHFRVRGPIVAQLQEVFAEDWAFTTGEALDGDIWFPALEPAGGCLARVIADGPDEDLDKLRWCLLGALGIARRSVRVVTPYFLPDAALVSALGVAAMRGVEVDVLIPERVNVPLVQWAMRATLWQVLHNRVRVWLVPAPFDHAKLMLVDGCWCLIGSANWDPRSLRLNFELDVECYDAGLALALDELVQARKASARPLSAAELDARRLPERLRDGVARLFTPVL